MFINLMTKKYSKEWKEYTEHEFGKKIADGTLEKEKFNQYMIQDIFYLNAYGECWKLLSELTNCKDEKKYALNSAQEIIRDELNYREEYSVENLSDIKKSRETKNYIEFMYKCARDKKYNNLFFALLGCFVGYAYLGKYIERIKSSDIYEDWIDIYTTEKFWDATDEILKMADRKWKEMDQKSKYECEEIFKKTLILEKEFFDQVM